MKKTSVYLDDAERERLARIAEREGKSQAEVIRAAIVAYAAKPRRTFALAGSVRRWRGDAPPASDDPQVYQDFIEGQMEGFGEPLPCVEGQ